MTSSKPPFDLKPGCTTASDSKTTELLRSIVKSVKEHPTDPVATTSTAPPDLRTPAQILESIRQAMTVLKEGDPIAAFLLRRGIDVTTQDVLVNDCHKLTWTDPPSYIKFTHLVEPDRMLAIERFDPKNPLAFFEPNRTLASAHTLS